MEHDSRSAMEFYLSELLGNAVLNQSQEKIGTLLDLIVADINRPHPKVTGFTIKRGSRKEPVFIPEHDIATLSPKLIKLSTDVVDLTPFTPRLEEVRLSYDVYDKQIVDIDDRRMARVNDLLLESEHEVLRLIGVDVSAVGVLTRLKIPQLGLLKRNVVDWEDVQFLGGSSPMKFKIQYKRLESMHPVDIARIIFEGPGYKEGSRVLSSLHDPIAADIIESLSPKLQRNLIESMKIEDVADVVDHMPAHRAADLLVTLGSDYANKIFPHLEATHTQQIKALLNYPEDSTGAFMSTEYVAVPQKFTLEQTIALVHHLETAPDFLLYFYVLENEHSNKLTGVISVYELFTKDLRSRVESVMIKRVITAYPHDPIRLSLKKMFRYDLSALPVIGKTEGTLLGIVTFREAVSIYLPKRWKVRIRQVLPNGF